MKLRFYPLGLKTDSSLRREKRHSGDLLRPILNCMTQVSRGADWWISIKRRLASKSIFLTREPFVRNKIYKFCLNGEHIYRLNSGFKCPFLAVSYLSVSVLELSQLEWVNTWLKSYERTSDLCQILYELFYFTYPTPRVLLTRAKLQLWMSLLCFTCRVVLVTCGVFVEIQRCYTLLSANVVFIWYFFLVHISFKDFGNMSVSEILL